MSLKGATEAVIATDDQGRVVAWNAKAEAVFGKTCEEAIGRPLAELLVSGSRDRQDPFASEELLSSVIEGIRDSVFVKDRGGVYRVINSAGAAMLGRTPKEVIGKDDRQLWTAEAAEMVRAADRQVLETGESRIFETTDEIQGRKKVLASMKSPFRDRQGKIQGVIGVSRDVTEQKRAEERLRQSEERFRALFEQAPFSVQLLAPDSRTLRVNRAWKELWQIPEDVVQNHILKDYRLLEDPQLEQKGIREYIERGFKGESTAVPAICYDPAELGMKGRPRWVTSVIHPIHDRDGKISELVLIHQDVTDRHQHEVERERLVGKLREAVLARDEFLSIASHELKTPLTTLMLQAQLQRRKISKGDSLALSFENLEKWFATNAQQLERLNRLIDDMLDISRITSGAVKLERRRFDLRALVGDVVDRYRSLLDQSGCELFLEPGAPVEGIWDRARIEQVFVNLLTNAMKYGAGKPITVRLSNSRALAILSVQDRGIGIAPEHQERIFQRFERAVHANEISGLGLGLYIVKHLVEAHRGSVELESAPAKGSVFTVKLPLE